MYTQYNGPYTLSTHTKPKIENKDKSEAEADNSTGNCEGVSRKGDGDER